ALRLEQYLRPQALTTCGASCRGAHAPSPAPAGVIASARSRTFPLLVLYRTSFHCAKPARNETNTAAHIRRVLRSTFQRTPAAAARSLSYTRKIMLLQRALDPDIDWKCPQPLISKEHHAICNLRPHAWQRAQLFSELGIRQRPPRLEIRFATADQPRSRAQVFSAVPELAFE